jgi:hypothetical protein
MDIPCLTVTVDAFVRQRIERAGESAASFAGFDPVINIAALRGDERRVNARCTLRWELGAFALGRRLWALG